MITPEDLYTEEFEEVEAIAEDDGNAEEHEEGEGNAPEAEEAPGTDPDATKKTVKPKRVVRNPQPKLDAETLKGKKGLTALPSYFERVSFKGKGYEEQDLSVILKTYEYWCHRLFPKYPFDACIAKLEKLGMKKGATQTLIKKIRLDMIYDHEPNLNDDDTDSDRENVNANNFDDLFNDVPNMLETPIEPPISIEITEEQQEQIRRNKERAEKLRQERLRKAQEMSQSSLQPSSHFSNDLSQVSMDSDQNLPSQADTSVSQTVPTIELSEEQQERIRLNREKAEKLRQERLRRAKELSDSSVNNENIFEENSSQVPSQVSNIELENDTSDEEQGDEDVDAIFNKIQEKINDKTTSNGPSTVETQEESGDETQNTIEPSPTLSQLEDMCEN